MAIRRKVFDRCELQEVYWAVHLLSKPTKCTQ